MAFVRKVWKNRISEFFNRYRLENVRTGEAFNAYINLNDGAVEEQGDRLNADALNDLERRIEEGFNSIESYDYSVMIAGTEATSTSSQAYTVGQYLIYNKLLYKVISAIAIGDTLTVGTNITQKKIAEEVSDHLVVNGQEFFFDYQGGKFGYNTSPSRGADTFNPFKSAAQVKILYPTINNSNYWSVSFSGLEIGSQIALGYYCAGNNGFGTTAPSASGAIIKYSGFYNYTYQLNMLLEVTATNVTVSGVKTNTNYLNGVSWAIS